MRYLVAAILCLMMGVGLYAQSPCNNQTSVTHQGYEYDIVEIGNQCWFAENCRYLPSVWPDTQAVEGQGSYTDPRYYVYGYEGMDVEAAQATANYQTYGVLYNWPAVMTAGICPSGWHIPTDGEWMDLEMSLGMSQAEANSTGWRGTDEGYQMKSTSGWDDGGNGSNSSGFNGLPGGYRTSASIVENGTLGYWWTSSPEIFANPLMRGLAKSSNNIYRYAGSYDYGFSARCVQNAFIGCTDIGACNYDSTAIIDDGSCEYLTCAGCTTTVACNYDPEATIDDGSCEFICEGCTDEVACNYDPSANVDDSSCEYLSCAGCTDAVACNFNSESTINDGSCLYPEQYYDCDGNCINDSDGDGICDELEITGCTDDGSCNFDIEATDEDGSCEYETCAGCQYEFACNYDPDATIADNESCEYGTCPGCTDSTACNYNPTVSEDDGSCIYTEEGYTCDGTCINDANGDGIIAVQDLLLVLSEFGCASSCENDINQDGYVAVQDILLLLSEFGNTCEISGFQNCGDDIGHEGYDYSTVQIGEQCWFSENCRYLPSVTANEESNDVPMYYVYDYQGSDVTAAQATSNYETYGALYNWSAVTTEGICPIGWHIPSDLEFTELTDFLGGENIAGEQMKSTSGWYDNGNGSNSSGFDGLPGGVAHSYGFSWNGNYGDWWSSSASGSWLAWKRRLNFNNGSVLRYNKFISGNYGFSARCVRD